MLWRRPAVPEPEGAVGAHVAFPFTYIANIAGWIDGRTGPPAVGRVRPAANVAPRRRRRRACPAGDGIFTLLGFLGLYVLIALLYVLFIVRIIARGPEDVPASPRVACPRRRASDRADGLVHPPRRRDRRLRRARRLRPRRGRPSLRRSDGPRPSANGSRSAIGPVWNGNEVWLIVGRRGALPRLPEGLRRGVQRPLFRADPRALAARRPRARARTPPPDRPSAVASGLRRGFLRCPQRCSLSCSGWPWATWCAAFRWAPMATSSWTLFHILNWYALLVGLLAVLVICAQAASFLALRAEGEPRRPCGALARRLVPAQLIGGLAMVGPTYAVATTCSTVFGHHPWALVFPLAGAAALAAAIAAQVQRAAASRAFAANCLAIVAACSRPWPRASTRSPARPPGPAVRPHHRQRRSPDPLARRRDHLVPDRDGLAIACYFAYSYRAAVPFTAGVSGGGAGRRPWPASGVARRSLSRAARSRARPARAAPPSSSQRRRPRRRSCRGTSSECSGSWWKSSRRFGARRGGRTSSASDIGEWPQPRWFGYSSSVYWQSWISIDAPRASSKPEIHSSSSSASGAPSAGLVVGDVAERCVVAVDPVAERRAAVVDRLGADRAPSRCPTRAARPRGRRRATGSSRTSTGASGAEM